MNSDEMNGDLTQLLYGQVVIGDHMIEKGVVAIEGQSIVYAGAEDDLPADLIAAVVVNQGDGAAVGANIMRLESGYLLPGFIDIHVHGGNGEDFMDADAQVLDTITSFHGSQGTTAMLATTMTAPKKRIDQVLSEVYAYMAQPMPYAQLEGVHLEGPFISPNWLGSAKPRAYSTAESSLGEGMGAALSGPCPPADACTRAGRRARADCLAAQP